MDDEPRFWRSIHGSGPYEANPISIPSWGIVTTPRERIRLGIFDTELEAVERAIRDNQRLARAIHAAIIDLKERRAALRAPSASPETR